MAKIEVSVGTGFYVDDSIPIANQQCVNLFPSVPETSALSTVQLKRTPGITLLSTNGTKTCRGMHVMDSVLYSVNGNNLYRVNADGTSDNLGSITGTSRVSMADNGIQLCIVVPGDTGYIFTASPDTLTTITDPDYAALGPSNQVVYKDGYFIHISKTLFFISALNDGLSYNALDFGTAEVDPDNNTAIHVSRNQLYIGGNETIELFQNVGGAGFPFQRVQGGVIQKGVKAKHSIIDFDNSFVFLGGGVNEQPAIWRFAGGGSAVKISTKAIDSIIASYTDEQLQAVTANTYSMNGGYFVCFQFQNRTLCYDADASAKIGKPMWHEASSRNSEGSKTRWRASDIASAYGMIIVGDGLGPNIGVLDYDSYTEYGTLIDRDWSLGPVDNNGDPFTVSKVDLYLQSGGGNPTTVDPQIAMSFSRDGYTFGNELTRSIGKVGEYFLEQEWFMLGQFRRYGYFKFSVSGEIDFSVIKLVLDIT